MINVLMCTYKSGDVLPLSLKPLVEFAGITKILIADGPHRGTIKPGIKFDEPSVAEIAERLNKSGKIHYKYSDSCINRAIKNNEVLKHTTKDCNWILNVDSDEIYHEDGLKRLFEFILTVGKKHDKYRIKTIDPIDDFFHEIRIPDWKPRLYKYKKGFVCPPGDCRAHQYVVDPKKISSCHADFENLPEDVCKIYHLNALRNASLTHNRITKLEENSYCWSGGNRKFYSEKYEIDKKEIPNCILMLKKDTLWTT